MCLMRCTCVKADGVEQAYSVHDMLSSLEVMSWNPSQVELEVHSTGVQTSGKLLPKLEKVD